MLDNHTYNLVKQFTQEHKSLWRIKNAYIKDAQGCEACGTFWNKMTSDKEEHIEELKALIKEHL